MVWYCSMSESSKNLPEFNYLEWVTLNLLEAHIEIIKSALKVAEARGPGNGVNLFLEINTRLPGAQIPSRIREAYPKQLNLQLEHEFSQIITTKTGFYLTLKFGGVPEQLFIPWYNIIRFHDINHSFVVPVAKLKEECPVTLDNSSSNLSVVSLDAVSDSSKKDPPKVPETIKVIDFMSRTRKPKK